MFPCPRQPGAAHPSRLTARPGSHSDRLWEALSAGGAVEQCGWLKDRYGVSWQITPKVLVEMLSDPDQKKAQRVMQAMMQMIKIDIEGLRRAYDDVPAA